jgi:hypothetical protein
MGGFPLGGVIDASQGAMLFNASQMGFNRKPGAIMIGIAPGQTLSLFPPLPTLNWCSQFLLTNLINVSKIAGRPSFNQGHHFAGHQVSQTIQQNVDPFSVNRGLQLGGTMSNLKTKHCLLGLLQFNTHHITPDTLSYLTKLT